MPGGNEEAWPYVKDVLQAISAKSDGEPCCQWVGDGMVRQALPTLLMSLRGLWPLRQDGAQRNRVR
jgi:hypothetical protein